MAARCLPKASELLPRDSLWGHKGKTKAGQSMQLTQHLPPATSLADWEIPPSSTTYTRDKHNGVWDYKIRRADQVEEIISVLKKNKLRFKWWVWVGQRK